jgi:hypothetical protein
VRRSVWCWCVASAAAVATASTAIAAPRSFTVVGVESGQSTSATTRGETEVLRSGTKQIGHDRTVCNNGAVSTCRTTFYFAAGTIRTRGRSTNATNFSFAIVGGTGAYEGATGTLSVHVLSATRERETFTFR